MVDIVKKSDVLIELDNIIGLREWGLIFYGALPSNLALLGTLEVKIGKIDELSPAFLIFASILPVFLIFMLIRDRQKEWYLTTDFLNLRSANVTIMILILATLISGISGVIHNRYSFAIPQNWSWNEWIAVIESFLLAVASLVISSALFMTALTKEGNLPGLPTVEFVKLMKELQKNIRQLKNSEIWVKYIPLDNNGLIDLVKTIEKDLNQAKAYPGNYLIKESLKPLYNDIVNLRKVLEEIRDSGGDLVKQDKWKLYFAIEQKYLFSWDQIPGGDNGRLINFLKKDYCIDWLEMAKIEKIVDGKTIRASFGKNFLSLSLNNEKTKANIKIDDGRDGELTVKIQNSKLNIFQCLSEEEKRWRDSSIFKEKCCSIEQLKKLKIAS